MAGDWTFKGLTSFVTQVWNCMASSRAVCVCVLIMFLWQCYFVVVAFF